MKAFLASTVITLLFHFEIAHALTLEAKYGRTEFLAVGRPAAIQIHGTGSGPQGELTVEKKGNQRRLTGTLSVSLGSLETGIGLRDRHMKEKYLETEKYEKANISFEGVTVPSDLFQSGGEIELPADLSLHGMKKNILLKVRFKPESGLLLTKASFQIKLSDFAIEIPKFSGMTVADEVQVDATSDLPAASLKEIL